LRHLALAAAAAALSLVAAQALIRGQPPRLAQSSLGLSTPVAMRNAARAAELVRRAAHSESVNDAAAARALLLQAIEADPENAEARFRLGGLLLGSQPERAKEEYALAKRLDAAKYGQAVDAILTGF
jgi:hypothetical protein